MASSKLIRMRSALLLLLPAFLAGSPTGANAEQDAEPKVAAAAKRERLTLKDVKIEGGALVVSGSTGLPSRRVTILNSPTPRIAVTSDRKGDFAIRRTDFRPDDCRLTIGVVSGTQTALVANCGPRGVEGPRGSAVRPALRGARVRRAPAARRETKGTSGHRARRASSRPFQQGTIPQMLSRRRVFRASIYVR